MGLKWDYVGDVDYFPVQGWDETDESIRAVDGNHPWHGAAPGGLKVVLGCVGLVLGSNLEVVRRIHNESTTPGRPWPGVKAIESDANHAADGSFWIVPVDVKGGRSGRGREGPRLKAPDGGGGGGVGWGDG